MLIEVFRETVTPVWVRLVSVVLVFIDWFRLRPVVSVLVLPVPVISVAVPYGLDVRSSLVVSVRPVSVRVSGMEPVGGNRDTGTDEVSDI